jgi:hypothetical protein
MVLHNNQSLTYVSQETRHSLPFSKRKQEFLIILFFPNSAETASQREWQASDQALLIFSHSIAACQGRQFAFYRKGQGVWLAVKESR